MKTIAFVSLALIAVFYGCKKDSDTVKESFDYMHYERKGGGQIDFNLYTTGNVAQVKVDVSKYSFRDTSIQFTIDKNAENASAFALLQDAINKKVQINGNFQQPTAPTGTWSYIYLVSGDKETEVTSTELRNSLAEFEKMVKDGIE